MKKIFASILIMIMIFSISTVYATNNTLADLQEESVIKIREKEKTKIEEYTEKYGSESYGMAAYILSKIRIYSIPCCFMGIVVGLLYQYVIGTRRLDKKHKGFNLILSFVTILVICQVLPLVFAVIVTNWRG